MNKSAIKHLKKLLLAVCLIPAETHAATVKWTDGGITFEADDTKSEATAATTTNTGEVTIPSSVAYNGKTYTVTIIKSQFIGTNNKTVTSVTIPSTVTRIGGDAGASSSYRIGEDDDAATTQANCLVAATDATRVAMTETREGTPYTNMGLNGGKFRPFTADGTMAYNKCWLSIPTSMVGTAAGAKALMLDFDGATTGIAGIDAEPTNGASATEGYYTLQGVRVNQPHKGVYIYKGKKIVIK